MDECLQFSRWASRFWPNRISRTTSALATPSHGEQGCGRRYSGAELRDPVDEGPPLPDQCDHAAHLTAVTAGAMRSQPSRTAA